MPAEQLRNLFDTPLFKAIPSTAADTAPRRASGSRMYAAAQGSRLNGGFQSQNTSADAELKSSLVNMRARSRQLVRDVPFAKAAKRTIVNNVIGTGVRLQALVGNTRGSLNQRVNDSIEAEWALWSDAASCHTGGSIHFSDMERLIVGQCFEAGEIFIRLHRQVMGGTSKVPLCLEVIEAERVADAIPLPVSLAAGQTLRQGIETDEFQRPIAYWFRKQHLSDIRPIGQATDSVERVPASDVIHMRVVDRWPQTRGEPWMHSVASKLLDMGGYSEAEIIAARAAANIITTIETPEDPSSIADQQQDGSFQQAIEPGMNYRLLPGEKMSLLAPQRPNPALEAFMRFMLREVAAGIGTSFEALSKDYGEGNYSSMRMAILDDRDAYRALQLWFVRGFRTRLHAEWMKQAVLANAIPGIDSLLYWTNVRAYNGALFRPRGWSWVDPTKEVEAFKSAIKGGLTTLDEVVASTSGGADLEDVLRTRADEIQSSEDKNLFFDTSPKVYVPAETRGLMMLTEEGIEPVASVVPPPGAPPGAPAKDDPAEDDKSKQKSKSDDDRNLRRVI